MSKALPLNVSLMSSLFNAIGPSGHERAAAIVAAKELKKCGGPFLTDGLGSFVVKVGKSAKGAPKVLALAHVDEVGFVVKAVTPAGGLKLLPVGGIDPVTLFGQRIKLLTRNGKVIYGAFHYGAADFAQRKAPTTAAQLVADFGFADKKQALRLVHVGDPVVFAAPFEISGNGRILAKAVDDRLGVLALIGAARKLKGQKMGIELWVGFSVQEEVGTRGGKTVASLVNPDFGIVCDVSNALDAGGSKEIGALGAGVQFRPRDAGMIQNPEVSVWYRALLEKKKIPYQTYISPGGTDAAAMHLSGSGVPTVQIGLVAREIHSASTMFDPKDLGFAISAIVAACLDLDQKKIELFKKQ